MTVSEFEYRKGTAARRGGPSGGRRVADRRKEKLTRSEKRHLLQLVACGAIFVSIVAARLLLPEKMAELSSSLSAAMGRNMDIQEVFSAVGKAVSGDASASDTLGDVYHAVFHPEEGEAVETAAQLETFWPEQDALEDLRTAAEDGSFGLPQETVQESSAEGQTAGQEPEPSVQTAPEAVTSQQQTGTLSAVNLAYSNLPNNVCMEQQILGFSYTTPVTGAVLSSPFGYREHPIDEVEKFHYGLDLAADEGTEIDAFANGTVSAVGESSSLGKYLIIEHGNGYSTLYAHCSRVTVSSGAGVTEGQKVAEVGQTGQATGPHCHFELHRDSNYLNPIYYVSLA